VIERLVLARIVPRVTSSPNFDGIQSAYRTKHSTETTLLKITNDVYEDLDQHQSTLLVALDQSAAFDCTDHSTMIRRLEHTFGITDLALDWMTSYLSDRSFYVRWGNTSSSKLHVNTGVPQRIVPWTFVFQSVCCSVVTCAQFLRRQTVTTSMLTTHKIIYISASKSDLSDKVNVLQQCTVAVRHWMLSNGLQLNPSKSDVIQFVIGRGHERVDDVASIQVSHTTIQPSSTLKNLGFTLDRQLSFDQHIVESTYAKHDISTSELYDTFASHCLMTSQQPLHAV